VPFKRGIVGMARRATAVDTANSQFFFMFADGSSLNGQYTVIARWCRGMDVVDKLRRRHPARAAARSPSRQDGKVQVASDISERRWRGVAISSSLCRSAVCSDWLPAAGHAHRRRSIPSRTYFAKL